ncbi:ComEC/Rec2 family competence protein [Dyadobacter sediminis]|uniref:ComEC family competence protein n=1 Tax=Dyadobacter sediminis TaxID=1493691 RepID=A0A5R9KJE8_9BACT|nr:ComEC/Rec2 family competence protein [Dyadobacter sediminis]TLU96249.1 ComEC family competence protein [Dyadobacter sediminis]GGB80544.1 competence protein ComEC [Dyadobacter sediminis]
MLSRAPFVSIVAVLVTGILLSGYFTTILPPQYAAYAAAVLLILSALFHFKHRKTAFSVSFSVFLLFTGIYVRIFQDNKLNAELNALQLNSYSDYELEIKTLPEKRQQSVRMEATVHRILSCGKWIPVSAKALVSIPTDAESIPEVGDRLVVHGNMKVPEAPANPFQFDYRRYLRNKGIQWTVFLPDGTFAILPKTAIQDGPGLWSLKVSEWADHEFRKNMTDDRSYGLVKAMLLGRRDDLRSDQVDDYTTSGTVHILSVSGMHVAIIFLTVSFLLGWMKRWKYGKMLYLVTSILMLGFYALVTGMPPSVQRATLMCIVFVVAEVFGRKQHAVNTLAVSAFLILFFDPYALYDVGFQLSYLAMTGIFLLYEPICSIFAPTHRVIRFTWQITALSFAAQLATFPISLYYFHQFPSYFWLVNPFVIAFTNVLLPAALLLLVVSFVNVFWLQTAVNFVVDISARLTNISVAIPKKLPGFLIENLNLNMPEVLMLYVLLFLVWYAYQSREYVYLKYAYALVFIFISCAVSGSMITFLKEDTIIYAIPGHSVMGFKKNARLYLVADKAFRRDTNAYDYYVRNYVANQEIDKTIFISDQ